MKKLIVSTLQELIDAMEDKENEVIHVKGKITGSPSLYLSPGQQLVGDGNSIIEFKERADGIEISRDNTIDGLTFIVEPTRRAIYNKPDEESLGTLSLKNIKTIGQVQIVATGTIRSGHVVAQNVEVIKADTRELQDRPKGFGVYVLQGAFTLWNRQTDKDVTITAHLTGLKVGSKDKPVQGGGVFISGAGDVGGVLKVELLETGEIHSNGGIKQGTPDVITGGVFVVYGANVKKVINRRPVTTYGVNDMVLDNWGTVGEWIAEDRITSHGPSGIGFVNFNEIGIIRILSDIETDGIGARGFNVYAGSVKHAEFKRIVTRANASVGIQVSRPVGTLIVHEDIETYGGEGGSLVKGVITKLSADGLSVKEGGTIDMVEIGGKIITNGPNVRSLHVQGEIKEISVKGGIISKGSGSKAVLIENGNVSLNGIEIQEQPIS
ncbi:hypothetical protein [Psychrobacillus lasiicapitis]|uniref:hypothetical protein n=1 Tax=Psychrobacillus lasiicapitis TaxID=1636719 RepID=UPI0019943D03|nr:hypothetical protein [Psychrobacillus lasiicapitis]GGA39016.1 hypothetical protein GCM10011384_30700 [Psychrobacillus lasiicapitis]